MLRHFYNDFMALVPLQLPQLIDVTTMEKPQFYGDYVLLTFPLRDSYDLEEVMDMFEDDMELITLYHHIPMRVGEFGHSTCAYSNPAFGQMFKMNARTEEDGKVHVTTVDEFLAAIAPDTTIYLEPGVYDLSTAAGCGVTETDRYHWDLRFDGPSLVITGVDGLTIEGAGAESVTIAAVPRYADVLGFERCADLTLRGFTAGHTEEKGYCTGGVLYFDLCDDAVIDGCALFGCGIMGITAGSCADMNVSNTEIYDCTYGAVTLNDSTAVFDGCDIHDNGGPDFQLYNSTAIVDGKEQIS